MARGKKKEAALSPEERLQAALVPESEQPYKVPENWCWVYWGACGDFQAGSAFKNEYQGITEYAIPFYKVGSLKYSNDDGTLYDTSNTINEEIRNKLKASLIPENSIIFAKIGEAIRLNRRSINPVPCCIDNNLMSFHSKVCLTKYVYFWSLGIDLYNYTNATTVPAIRKSDLEKVSFPLSPCTEQQRIVDRIESLFTKLDEAKQKAQDALDSFETRKAAILHKAFTGELTAQWRKEHGVGMESWKTVSVSKICHSLKYGTAKKSLPEGKVVVIRMGNLQDGEIDWSDLAYSNDPEDIEKYSLMPGDVLFNRTNSPALVGKTSIYRGEYPAIYAGYLIKLDYDRSRIIGDYLNYSLNTVSAKRYCNSVKTDGVNQSNINAKKIGAYVFAMPIIEEQTEIVRILDDLLAKEQQAKEAAEKVLEQIDLTKKAILARAFHGELGTNDPNEESAVELLKQVL